MFLDTILKHSVKHFLLSIIESDRLATIINLYISGTNCDRDFKCEIAPQYFANPKN